MFKGALPGFRDFYPQEFAERAYIMRTWREVARRYAFAFFFRLMIPFRHVRNVDGRLAELPVSADEILPGRDPYLDFICDRILSGGDFVLPSELALPHAA